MVNGEYGVLKKFQDLMFLILKNDIKLENSFTIHY